MANQGSASHDVGRGGEDTLYIKLQLSDHDNFFNHWKNYISKRKEHFPQAWARDSSVWLAFHATGDKFNKLKSVIYNTLKLKIREQHVFSSLAALSADASRAMAEDHFAETVVAVSPAAPLVNPATEALRLVRSLPQQLLLDHVTQCHGLVMELPPNPGCQQLPAVDARSQRDLRGLEPLPRGPVAGRRGAPLRAPQDEQVPL